MPTQIPQGSRSPRLPRPQRRQQLIDVSRGVFAERGFDATSLEEIAERAGVSRPILYSHFGDKQGLFEAVVNGQIENVRGVVSAALEAPGEPRELVERSMRAFFTYVRDNPDGHAVLTRDAPVHLSGSGLGVMLDGLETVITELISRQARLLGVDPAPAPIFANALIGVATHVGRWWRDKEDVSLETVTAHTTDLIWNGFGGIAGADAD